MTLSPGEKTPRHHHSEVTDNIFGLTGDLIVTLEHPNETITLGPGTRCTILPGRVHTVVNKNAKQKATYLLVQGVGRYDFLTDDFST